MGTKSREKKERKDPIHQKHVEYTSLQMELQQMGQQLQQLGGLLQHIQKDYSNLRASCDLFRRVITDVINGCPQLVAPSEEVPEGATPLKAIDIKKYVDDFVNEMKESQQKAEEQRKAAAEASKQVAPVPEGTIQSAEPTVSSEVAP